MNSIAVALLIASTPAANFWEVLAAGLRGGQQGMAQAQRQQAPYAPRYPYAQQQVYAPNYGVVLPAPVNVGCFTDSACGAGSVCIMVAGIGQCVKRVQY